MGKIIITQNERFSNKEWTVLISSSAEDYTDEVIDAKFNAVAAVLARLGSGRAPSQRKLASIMAKLREDVNVQILYELVNEGSDGSCPVSSGHIKSVLADRIAELLIKEGGAL